MSQQQQKQQQVIKRAERRHLQELRVLIASIAVLFLIGGAVLWILSSQGILQGPLSNVLLIIFAVLGLRIGLFQWLFPVSSPAQSPSVLSDTSSGAQVGGIIDHHPTSATVPPTRTDVSVSGLTQGHSDSKIKYNHIAAPPGNLF